VADPVSWLMIEPGWAVLDRDGNEIGTVKDVLGDEDADIFSGVAVSSGLLAKRRVVAAESVTLISEGRIETDIGPDDVDELPVA
jgi:uncharacterized protein YrrD